MTRTNADPQRAASIRAAGLVILGLSSWLVLASLALQYGTTTAAVSNGVVGALVALLSLTILRNPFGSAASCWLTAVGGLWFAAAPFVLGYFNYTISAGNNVWCGIIIVLASVFVVGEVLRLNVPIVQAGDDTESTTRAEPGE